MPRLRPFVEREAMWAAGLASLAATSVATTGARRWVRAARLRP